MNSRTSSSHSAQAHAVIDRALRQLGSAQPDPGMNDRLRHQIHQVAAAEPASRRIPAFGWPRLAFATLAGGCLCAAVVIGSVHHSHVVAAQNRPVVPILQRQSGVSTASSARIAAHPPAAPKGSGRSDNHLGQGRATVPAGTHVHGGDGVTVPGAHPIH